jgi:hypothetical protein
MFSSQATSEFRPAVRPVDLGNVFCGTPKYTPPPTPPLSRSGSSTPSETPPLTPKLVMTRTRPRKSEMIRGVEWFYYFVPKEHSMGLSEVTPNYKSKFLVCLHRPSNDGKTFKMFAAFDNYLQFLNYIRDIPRENWHFFELILGSVPQKFYMDIDIKEEYVPIGEGIDSFTKRLMECLIGRIEDVFVNYLELHFDFTKNLLLFTSHAQTKRSFHIVVDGYRVANNQENTDLMALVLDTVPEEFIEVQEGPEKGSKIIDIGMYSKKQQFRCYGSRKPERAGKQGRPKIFQEEFEFDGKYYRHDFSEIPPMTEANRKVFEFTWLFQKSCVTFVDQCQPVVITEVDTRGDEDDDRIRHRPRLWSERGAFDDHRRFDHLITPQMVEKAIEKVNPEVWSIAEVNGGMIGLRRKMKALCNICEREHEHENAYVSIDPKWGNVYFHCWREIDSGGERFVKIGEVESPYQKIIGEQHVASVIAKLVPKKTVTPPLTPPILPFTGSVSKFVRNVSLGKEGSYF